MGRKERCPRCGSKKITITGNVKKCNVCKYESKIGLKPIFDFFEAYFNFVGSPDYNAEKFLREDCEDRIKSLTEDFIGETCDNLFWDGREGVIKKYGLKPFIDVRAIGVSCE